MTKKEKIIEAYGEHWEQVKGIVDKDGWITNWHYVNCRILDCEMKTFGGSPSYRPTCLKGIETNNGWIKIESESDLPKGEGKYYTMSKENQSYIRSDSYERAPQVKDWWLKYITHYQEIVKPLPPIY